MSRADDLRAQYETKIARVGQWVVVRRYTGTTTKTYADTLTRAYVRYYKLSEFIGPVTQGDMTTIALVDMLSGVLPVTTNDKLVTGFTGHDDPDSTPALSGGHVTGGKETAIKSVMKRTPDGTLIAIEMQSAG
jgi:hypothetical protein